MHLRLLIPELVWSEPADAATLSGLRCPALGRLLGRGNAARRPRSPWETVLAAEFGLEPDAPFGALRLLGESCDGDAARDGWWLCADPVHLRLHQERMVLADAGAIGIDAAEAAELVAALDAHFADPGGLPGCEAGAGFLAPAAGRWYLRLDAGRPTDAVPLSAVAGRRIESMPAGFVGFINEAQTLLHAHPVNARREADGQPPVNSLWLWGGGRLPAALAAPFGTVWSNAPLAIGLARTASIAARPLPASLDALLADAAPAAGLAFVDALLEPALYEDGDAWRDALGRLDADWFGPLAAALATGRITSAAIVAPTAYGVLEWRLDRLSPWKLWRRSVSLADLARRLAESSR